MHGTGFDRHDHGRCIADAIAAAERHCAETRAQLTPIRRRVLEILLGEHRAMGAYEVLEVLRAEGQPAQPPVAYRALEFLVRLGFVHRIERLNAFVACARPGEDHLPGFLICRGCRHVAETRAQEAPRLFGPILRDGGFILESVMVEAEGLCPGCRAARSE
jgi:Fur family zinc uptake transcriptional regulator